MEAEKDLIKEFFVDKLISELKQKDEQIKELVEALEHIVNPIKKFREYADKEGAVLNGMYANQLANDANYLREQAKTALLKHNAVTK